MEVKIPKEIANYSEKLLFNLTVRQTICSILALGLTYPTYWFLKRIGWSESSAEWSVILIGAPIFAVGWFKYNGMSLEKFIFNGFLVYFWYPPIRKLRYKNEMEVGINVINAEEVKARKRNKRNKGKASSEAEQQHKDNPLQDDILERDD